MQFRFRGPPGSIETSGDDAQDEGGKAQNLEQDAETVSDSDGGFSLNTPDDTSARVSPDASTDAQTPAAKAVFGDVTPLTVAEAKSIFDASQFPAAEGTAASDSSRPTFATFNIHDEFQRVVDESVKTIKDLNWKVIARDDSSENRVVLYYILNQHLFIRCSIRQESKSRTRMDVTVLGNVDIRSIPKMEVSQAVDDKFQVEYRNSLPLGKTQMHSVDYMSIPFHEPLEEGSGRTIPLSVFFNTKSSFDEGFDFYR